MLQLRTPQERRAFGQARRKQVRRQDQNRWRASDRQTDPLHALTAAARGRIPALLALKYELMAASPFGFFRGAVPIMASDLAALPHAGIDNQLCGDAHVRNLGAYAAPDGRLVFDINDFDETIQGPFEWDIKRLATSLVLAGRETGAKGPACTAAALVFLARYRAAIRSFARMPVLEMAHFQVHRLQRITPLSEVLRKAERETPLTTLDRLTEPAKGAGGRPAVEHRVFREARPVQFHLPSREARAVLDALGLYRESLSPERQHILLQYRPLDVAFRVVGTGSVGLRDYVVYFEGNGPGDPLFLQIKEEPGSAYAAYVSHGQAAQHQGRRVVDGQRAMQFQSDPFLGWTNIQNRHYLVRQLNDHKASIAVEDLAGDGLQEYAEICGQLLARGHARSGDAVVLDGYIGNSEKFDQAVAAFAIAYADQTERDYKTFMQSRLAPRGQTNSAPHKPKPASGNAQRQQAR